MAKAKKTSRATAPPGVRSWCSAFCRSSAVRIRVHAVDRPQRADDHLARGQRRDQSDADLPVEAQRLDDRLDRACPIVPARLFSMFGGLPSCSGRCASTHRTTDTSRITVPARRRNTFERSSRRSPATAEWASGTGGISSTKGALAALQHGRFQQPRRRRPPPESRARTGPAAPPRACRGTSPASGRSGMKAAMISV